MTISRFLPSISLLAFFLVIFSFTSSSASAVDDVCVSRADGVGGVLVVTVDTDKEGVFIQKSFARVTCENSTAYVQTRTKKFCNITASYSPKLVMRFKDLYGLSPAEICASASKGN